MEKIQVNNVINYLSTKSEYVGQNNYGAMFDEYPIEEIMAELERLNVLTLDYRQGGKLYLLTQPAKNDIRFLPKEFENDPWGFWLDDEKKKLDEDSIHRIHTHTIAKDEHDNYNSIRKQRNAFFIIAIVELLAIITLGILQLKSRS
ncbi:MAG TPA: hypothetical protein VIZ28_17635 [Chitinophagaceae bacterium]